MGLINALNAVIAKLPGGIGTFVGPEFLKQHNLPPRIVFVPRREPWGPTENVGSDPRQLYTRACGVQCFLWGADYAATETLINQFVTALHAYAYGSEVGEFGEWDPAADGLVKTGRLYVLDVMLKVPVVETPSTWTTGPVTSIPETPVLVVGAPPHDSSG
jgi:hypothetical protein